MIFFCLNANRKAATKIKEDELKSYWTLSSQLEVVQTVGQLLLILFWQGQWQRYDSIYDLCQEKLVSCIFSNKESDN